jgi:predicted dehydrogenase
MFELQRYHLSLLITCTDHFPAIKLCSLLSLKAIYSRSRTSAESAVKDAGVENIEIYSDSPEQPSQTLSALLARTDIQAVIIALPILVQPEVIWKCMAAGKHILSEKPIAKDVTTARALLDLYQPLSRDIIWAVGENFRLWPEVEKAFGILQKSDSKLVTFSIDFSTLVNQSDKYFQTDWYVSRFSFYFNPHFYPGATSHKST